MSFTVKNDKFYSNGKCDDEVQSHSNYPTIQYTRIASRHTLFHRVPARLPACVLLDAVWTDLYMHFMWYRNVSYFVCVLWYFALGMVCALNDDAYARSNGALDVFVQQTWTHNNVQRTCISWAVQMQYSYCVFDRRVPWVATRRKRQEKRQIARSKRLENNNNNNNKFNRTFVEILQAKRWRVLGVWAMSVHCVECVLGCAHTKIE